ncbi:hypothetical protein CR513_10988, partial [Mucuna pruriens]
MEEESKPIRQQQRRMNLTILDVVKKEGPKIAWMTLAHHKKPWLRRVVLARLTCPRTGRLCRSRSPIRSGPLRCTRRQSSSTTMSLLEKLAAQATQGSETENLKIVRGDRLDYQCTLVDLLLSILAKGEPSSFDHGDIVEDGSTEFTPCHSRSFLKVTTLKSAFTVRHRLTNTVVRTRIPKNLLATRHSKIGVKGLFHQTPNSKSLGRNLVTLKWAKIESTLVASRSSLLYLTRPYIDFTRSWMIRIGSKIRGSEISPCNQIISIIVREYRDPDFYTHPPQGLYKALDRRVQGGMKEKRTERLSKNIVARDKKKVDDCTKEAKREPQRQTKGGLEALEKGGKRSSSSLNIRHHSMLENPYLTYQAKTSCHTVVAEAEFISALISV